MSNQSKPSLVAATFPVTEEILSVTFEANCRRADNLNSVTLEMGNGDTQTVTLDIIATRPDIHDFNCIDSYEPTDVPSCLLWRVSDWSGCPNDIEGEYRPIVIDQTSGRLFIEDVNDSFGFETDRVYIKTLSPYLESIGWGMAVSDMAQALPHKPVIEFVLVDGDKDLNIAKIIIDDHLYGVIVTGLRGVYVTYVNNPMFNDCLDFIGDMSDVSILRIKDAAYEHWLACNAAGIAQ